MELPSFTSLAGIWIRECNYEPRDVLQDNRLRDGSTVAWAQAPDGHYIDVRDVKAEHHVVIRGFAGTLEISPCKVPEPGAFCLTWTRCIDTQPESCPSGVDSSVCRLVAGTMEAPLILVEEGDCFLEIWRRIETWDDGRDSNATFKRIAIGSNVFESGDDFVSVAGLPPGPLRSKPTSSNT